MSAAEKFDHFDPVYGADLYTQMLQESLALFSQDILGLDVTPHFREWAANVSEHNRLAILAARDHGKSVCFTYAYPIWRAWADPGCEVYLFANTMDQASEYLDLILYGKPGTALQGMIDIPELRHLVPEQTGRGKSKDGRLRLNKRDVRFTNGSRIRVMGYGKAVRGRHPKYVVCDDVLNDDDMWEEGTRRKRIEYFKSAISNLPPPGGQIIVVGTPFHLNDLYGWLRENKQYFFKSYPALIRLPGGKYKALYPKRYSVKQLLQKRLEIMSVAFSREFECIPLSDEFSMFPEFLFPPCFDNLIRIAPTRNEIRARKLSVFIGVDIARSASVGADFFVIFVIGKDPLGNHYILDIRRSKGLSFKKQLHEIEVVCKRYDPTLVYIESNAMQQIYSDELRRATDIPVKPFVTLASNKYPLDKGVPSLRLLLENQKMIIPRGDQHSIDVTNVWLDECRQFGYIDGKLQGLGSHDDTVMAWWLAVEAAKAGGFSFVFGEDEAGEEKSDVFGADGGDGENWEEVMLGDAYEQEAELASAFAG